MMTVDNGARVKLRLPNGREVEAGLARLTTGIEIAFRGKLTDLSAGQPVHVDGDPYQAAAVSSSTNVAGFILARLIEPAPNPN